MDDTTQAAQPTDTTQQTPVANMNDVAGMTPPPPAPVMPEPQPAAAQPAAMPTAPVAGGEMEDEDYAYAEDVLNEILDSLDRVEAKLEAIEKKLG